MKELLLTLRHLAVMIAKLCGPGGVRAVIAENLLLKQQLIRLFDRRTVGLAVDIPCRSIQQAREVGGCVLLPAVRRAAVAAGASIVLLAHVFQQA
jgi:hypothetical protein